MLVFLYLDEHVFSFAHNNVGVGMNPIAWSNLQHSAVRINEKEENELG